MNIVEYVIENRNYTFEKKAFSEVDAAVFAQLSYHNFSLIKNDIKLKELSSYPDLGVFTFSRNLFDVDTDLLKAVVNSKRYGNVIVSNQVNVFDNQLTEQFSATSFYIEDDFAIAAFRGTDGTLVGWKEDLCMTYMNVIYAQVDSAYYLQKLLSKPNIKNAYIVGHSKGGNLAVYAASRVSYDLQNKIKAVYNFDGPGFSKEFYESTGYKNIENITYKYVPKSSVVGKLMYNCNYKVVKAIDSGVMQHWLYNWELDMNGFIYEENTDTYSSNMETMFMNVYTGYSKEDLKVLSNLIFDIMDKNNLIYIDDIFTNKEQIIIFLKNYLNCESKDKIKLSKFLIKLALVMGRDAIVEKYKESKNEVEKHIVQSKNNMPDVGTKIRSFMSEILVALKEVLYNRTYKIDDKQNSKKNDEE